MQKPLILITNDDGIKAPGLRKLISLARGFGDVAVVAPDKPQSGMSHAITMSHPLRLQKIAEEEGYQEYSCNGTPVDSIKLGEQIVLGRNPDLVLSGINHGSNASVNIIYSGTMAAVIEATIDGIPAIGISLLDYSHDADFSHVDNYITAIIKNVLQKKLPKGVCLNVNIPTKSDQELKGIMVCRQAKGRWAEKFDIRTDPYKKDYYWLTGVFENGDASPESDTWALANNYISIVPVHYDLTAHHAIEEFKDWEIEN